MVACREAATFSGRKGGELVRSSVSGFPGMAAIMICDGCYTAFPRGMVGGGKRVEGDEEDEGDAKWEDGKKVQADRERRCWYATGRQVCVIAM